MNQALYAHMNNKRKMEKKKTNRAMKLALYFIKILVASKRNVARLSS
jgi:hypothetical protein